MLFLTGLSEAAGRLLPLVARRPEMSRGLLVGLLLTGAVVEGAVFGLWPLTASSIAAEAPGARHGPGAVTWTPSLLAPLLLAAVLAFPLLGPLFHLVLLAGVAAGLVSPLATAAALHWMVAAGCVTIAGVGLAAVVAGVRRLVTMLIATEVSERAG
jgi:hypothetical protein